MELWGRRLNSWLFDFRPGEGRDSGGLLVISGFGPWTRRAFK